MQKLEKYLQLSSQVLQGKGNWKKEMETKACLVLCASHLSKSFIDNIRRKTTDRKDKSIVNLAMKGLACLHESCNWEDLLQDIFQVFGTEYVTSETYDEAKVTKERLNTGNYEELPESNENI